MAICLWLLLWSLVTSEEYRKKPHHGIGKPTSQLDKLSQNTDLSFVTVKQFLRPKMSPSSVSTIVISNFFFVKNFDSDVAYNIC